MWRVKGTTQMSTSRVHPRKVAVSNKEADSLLQIIRYFLKNPIVKLFRKKGKKHLKFLCVCCIYEISRMFSKIWCISDFGQQEFVLSSIWIINRQKRGHILGIANKAAYPYSNCITVQNYFSFHSVISWTILFKLMPTFTINSNDTSASVLLIFLLSKLCKEQSPKSRYEIIEFDMCLIFLWRTIEWYLSL